MSGLARPNRLRCKISQGQGAEVMTGHGEEGRCRVQIFRWGSDKARGNRQACLLLVLPFKCRSIPNLKSRKIEGSWPNLGSMPSLAGGGQVTSFLQSCQFVTQQETGNFPKGNQCADRNEQLKPTQILFCRERCPCFWSPLLGTRRKLLADICSCLTQGRTVCTQGMLFPEVFGASTVYQAVNSSSS